MITRIEIDGFKSFQGLQLDLAPFQVVIGPNGSGKSNLFDAIRLLSRLASQDIPRAFQAMRGYSHELFTLYPNGRVADTMHFAVEMLTDLKVQDSWGYETDVVFPRLRYELSFRREEEPSGEWHPILVAETLQPVPAETDDWSRLHGGKDFAQWLHKVPTETHTFIVTDRTEPDTDNFLILSETNALIPFTTRSLPPRVQASKAKRTLLSRMETAEYPHVMAAREEMLRWYSLLLNPTRLRDPELYTERMSEIVSNENLSVLLGTIHDEPEKIHQIVQTLSSLLPEVRDLQVEFNALSGQFHVFLQTRGGRFYLPSLSDGTLRMLALAVYRHYPNAYKALCLEEPENGVHPAVLKRMVPVLRDMTSDLTVPEQGIEPFRQVLATTHSPELVSHLDVQNELLFAHPVTRIPKDPTLPPTQVTHISPVVLESTDRTAEDVFTLSQVLKYLEVESREEIRADLTGALRK